MRSFNNVKFFKLNSWLIVILLSYTAISAFSQIANTSFGTLDFYGNIQYSDRELKDAVAFTLVNREIKEIQPLLKDTLLTWYNRQGYLFMQVDSMRVRFSPDSHLVDFAVWIQEGPASYWGEIKISGVEDNLYAMIFRSIQLQQGSMFSGKMLENEIEKILTILENNGYPLATVEIISLTPQKKQDAVFINIELFISKGDLIKISEIDVTGNSLTKDYVVIRESRLKVGDVYSHKKVSAVRDVLQRTGYFKKVEKPKVVFNKNRALVKIDLEEGTGNTLDGIIGYIPPQNENDKGYFTGRLQFTFKNLLGTGRFLEAFWEKKDEYSQAIRFGYEEPWLFGIPLYAGIWFHQQIRDTTYVEREWNLSARYQPWNSLSVRLQLGQRSVLPDSVGSIRYTVPESHAWQLRGSIDYNTFDDLLNPRQGIHYHTSFTLGRKRNKISEYLSQTDEVKKQVNTRLLNVSAEAVLPLFRNQVLYLGLHGKEIKTGDRFVNIADQIRLGGARTLRGYEEDRFSGSRVAWINCEYRSIVGYHSRIFLFVDSGYYQRREENGTKIQQYRIGYGFGLRLETRVGMIGIDYGLGENDSLMEGKLHVGVVSSF